MLLPLKIEKGDPEPRGAMTSASLRRHTLDAVTSGKGPAGASSGRNMPLPKLDLSQ